MNLVPVLTQKIGSKKKNKSLKPIQCAGGVTGTGHGTNIKMVRLQVGAPHLSNFIQ